MLNILNKNIYFIIGILGALTNLYGYFFLHPHEYYILGSLALLLTAVHYKLLYFIAVELILFAGHSAILLGIGPYTQLALPVLLCFQLFIFYWMLGKENNVFLFIGIIGIALLSLGFTYKNQWIFFNGGFFIAIYAYYLAIWKKIYPAYIWAILNTAFSLYALYSLLS